MKRWRKRSDSSTQSGPNQNAAKKDKIDPRWKVRIQAIVLIGLMVIPGNLGTLIIYFTSEGFFLKILIWLTLNLRIFFVGSPIENSGNSTSNATEIDNYEYEDEQNLFNETLGTEGNDTIPVGKSNFSEALR